MKVLVSGARGTLGKALVSEIKARNWASATFDRAAVSKPVDELASIFRHYDCFIHAAANTNVEWCESNPNICYQDNYLLTETIATAASLAAIKLVYISSTGVYGLHQNEAYAEYSNAMPTTHHHSSKLLGEGAVMSLCPLSLVVRASWLYGGSLESTSNFVGNRIREAQRLNASGEHEMVANCQQYGVPSYSGDIAERILTLIEDQRAGIFNCTNTGYASRYQFVSRIMEYAGMPVKVAPVDANHFKRVAKVSDNEVAENWKMDGLGYPPMPAWEESLRDYLDLAVADQLD